MVLVVSLLAVLDGGCDAGGHVGAACVSECSDIRFAEVYLSCPTTTLTSVRLSGPCANGGDGSINPANFAYGNGGGIGSPIPGVCRVEFTFATGFTYSTDVEFTSMPTSQPASCPPCPPFVGPTKGAIFVDIPSDTCLAADAGADVGASDAADAGAE
jgi:hypothetical protein